ncbi:MAG: hypothetical protein L0I24_25030, partial [Pseudonocardia sp.]|nr:hypothetical protein [Pseudonocardia sp.]
DLRFPTTTGVTVTAGMRLQHRYLDRVVAASTRDPDVADVYVRVLGMMDRPTAMFAPRVVAAALRSRPDGRVTAPPPAPTLTRVA